MSDQGLAMDDKKLSTREVAHYIDGSTLLVGVRGKEDLHWVGSARRHCQLGWGSALRPNELMQ